MRVAIDGPAGAGKSSVGRSIAEALGCRYLDTGLLYRAVTWLALRANVPPDDIGRVSDLAGRARFSLAGSGRLEVNGESPGSLLRGTEVERWVSQVSAVPAVRAALLPWQREVGAHGCIVMVGRDIGSVVLPEADVKLWLTASPQERARRRGRELKGSVRKQSQVSAQLLARDEKDAQREVSPAVPAHDAVVLTTDELSQQEVVDRALDEIERALRKRGAQFLPADHT